MGAEPDSGTDVEVVPPSVNPGLVEALTSAYSTLIKRQRTASAAFVRWSSSTRRAHEFAWVDGREETLMRSGVAPRIGPSSPIHGSVNKMLATIELNPYERELQYGYPYVTGYLDGRPIRGPLLTIPIRITADGDTLTVEPDDEVVRFNSLPFRSEEDSAAHELALARLIDQTPEFPLGEGSARRFCESVARERDVELRAALDGRLDEPPDQPRSGSWLAIVDNAACFVAPKTSYFLASDLQRIGEQGSDAVEGTALGPLLGRRGDQRTSEVFADTRAKVFFPFSSNPNQRRVALLCREPQNRIITVQGPPGTGKSLTIANVACHLISTGKRVLITSQKDKALEVVDELLRSLDLPQLPMTLLRHDRDSRQELRERLDSIRKERSAQETDEKRDRQEDAFEQAAAATLEAQDRLAEALISEDAVARADAELLKADTFRRRLRAKRRFKRARRGAARRAPASTDIVGEQLTTARNGLLEEAIALLGAAAEHRVGEANRNERNELRAFSKLLGRSQTNYKNFSVFDRLKSEPDRCGMLLKILPCWIMTPDDVARLFPCEPGLFDVVIIDEASQCDLPSMTPVLYRAKQAIIAGDSKQMQAQRFAFTSEQVAKQAWHEQGLDTFDPDRWLDPSKIDLLQLASVRPDEEVFLEEHYRSLPPLIAFSNKRWYRERLRIMRDDEDRRFGEPDRSTVTLHHIEDGRVTPDTQENEREAHELARALDAHMRDPGYAHANFGVICLFEQQMRLVAELAGEQIDEELRLEHDLVVVNPDGFQGDERDVIYFSLSYDAKEMSQAALSARQAEREHVQGMLNVAFTRARDEIHVFHSAPIKEFGMASGRGAIRGWLEHCAEVQNRSQAAATHPLERTDSEFEAQVIRALAERGVRTVAQYPSCGFFIDIVAELDGERVAVECDGEIWHLDEHGRLRAEDLARQEILERAGWQVLRIPYRGWLENPDAHVERVLAALRGEEPQEGALGSEHRRSPQHDAVTAAGRAASGGDEQADLPLRLSAYQAAVVAAMKQGATEKENVLRLAREQLGYARLGSRIRASLEAAIQGLRNEGHIHIEDGEMFLTETSRNASISTYASYSGSRRSSYRTRRRRY